MRTDCEPCVLAIHAGMARACSDANPLARVHQLLAIAFDDTLLESVVWMPSHTTEAEVGVRRIGNGDFLSVHDRYGNGEADAWAKYGVEEHRVPHHIRKELKDAYSLVGRTAKWISHVACQPFQRQTQERYWCIEAGGECGSQNC